MIPIYGEPNLGDIVTFNEMNDLNKALEPLRELPDFKKSGLLINEKSSLNDTIYFFQKIKGFVKSLKSNTDLSAHVSLCDSYIQRCTIINQMIKENNKKKKNNEYLQ